MQQYCGKDIQLTDGNLSKMKRKEQEKMFSFFGIGPLLYSCSSLQQGTGNACVIFDLRADIPWGNITTYGLAWC